MRATVTTITDEQIRSVATTAKPFSLVQLAWAEGREQDGADAIELEHQRRMVALRADGVIAVLCPMLSERRRHPHRAGRAGCRDHAPTRASRPAS